MRTGHTCDRALLRFACRREAGRELAGRLSALVDHDPVVLGLARGGIPVAAEVARALEAPLDVLIVRKICALTNSEYSIGAIAEGGIWVLDHEAIERLLISSEQLESAGGLARDQVDALIARYRQVRPQVDIRRRTTIVVDDGMARAPPRGRPCELCGIAAPPGSSWRCR